MSAAAWVVVGWWSTRRRAQTTHKCSRLRSHHHHPRGIAVYSCRGSHERRVGLRARCQNDSVRRPSPLVASCARNARCTLWQGHDVCHGARLLTRLKQLLCGFSRLLCFFLSFFSCAFAAAVLCLCVWRWVAPLRRRWLARLRSWLVIEKRRIFLQVGTARLPD